VPIDNIKRKKVTRSFKCAREPCSIRFLSNFLCVYEWSIYMYAAWHSVGPPAPLESS